ncbi:MAG: hypothetical protein JXN62_09390 [Bacteroidales bacterium]|nr:hypothetical protein [Bacteroidales bacterium]
MYKIINRRIAALMLSFFLFSSVAFSQFSDIEFLRSAPADGIKFLEAYLGPWANAFGAGLNGSWYNTAKPHTLGGFDITLGINAGIVPVSAETFEISSLGLSSSLSGSGSAPSVAGPAADGPEIVLSQSGVELTRFNTPPGTEWRYIPVPTAQVGIGLPLGTEIKGRFLPRIPVSDGDVMLWGLGLMHSIMQYIPGNEILPVDASVFAGYTRINANVPLSLEPGSPSNYLVPIDFSDQNLSATVDALNVSAIASFNLPVINFYGGLGYSRTNTIFKLSGNFPAPVLVTTPTPHSEYNEDGVIKGSDFPEMKIENFSGLRANIGFRIKLAVVTFHADYTWAHYSVLSTGLGISFR